MLNFKSGVLAKAGITRAPSQRLLLYIEACQRHEADPHRDAAEFVRHEGMRSSAPRVSEMRRILKLSRHWACGAILTSLDRMQLQFAVLAKVMLDINRHLRQRNVTPTLRQLEDWAMQRRQFAGKLGGPTRTGIRVDLKPSAVRLTDEIEHRLNDLHTFYGKRSGAKYIADALGAMQSYRPHAKKISG